jgi:phosphorylcholine metabolism protein LicD
MTLSPQAQYLFNIIHLNFYDIWSKLQPILEKHNLAYFAIEGSLLGAVREQKIIEHDDDMDIAIMESEEHKLFK